MVWPGRTGSRHVRRRARFSKVAHAPARSPFSDRQSSSAATVSKGDCSADDQRDHKATNGAYSSICPIEATVAWD